MQRFTPLQARSSLRLVEEMTAVVVDTANKIRPSLDEKVLSFNESLLLIDEVEKRRFTI